MKKAYDSNLTLSTRWPQNENNTADSIEIEGHKVTELTNITRMELNNSQTEPTSQPVMWSKYSESNNETLFGELNYSMSTSDNIAHHTHMNYPGVADVTQSENMNMNYTMNGKELDGRYMNYTTMSTSALPVKNYTTKDETMLNYSMNTKDGHISQSKSELEHKTTGSPMMEVITSDVPMESEISTAWDPALNDKQSTANMSHVPSSTAINITLPNVAIYPQTSSLSPATNTENTSHKMSHNEWKSTETTTEISIHTNEQESHTSELPSRSSTLSPLISGGNSISTVSDNVGMDFTSQPVHSTVSTNNKMAEKSTASTTNGMMEKSTSKTPVEYSEVANRTDPFFQTTPMIETLVSMVTSLTDSSLQTMEDSVSMVTNQGASQSETDSSLQTTSTMEVSTVKGHGASQSETTTPRTESSSQSAGSLSTQSDAMKTTAKDPPQTLSTESTSFRTTRKPAATRASSISEHSEVSHTEDDHLETTLVTTQKPNDVNILYMYSKIVAETLFIEITHLNFLIK